MMRGKICIPGRIQRWRLERPRYKKTNTSIGKSAVSDNLEIMRMADDDTSKRDERMRTVAGMLAAMPPAIESILPEVLKLRATRTLKADGSYVTGGDLLVQQTLLHLIRRYMPAARVISEEQATADSGQEEAKGTVVVVDPIDGTENFTSGLPEWGVSVAVYDSGRPAGFLLGCPEMGIWLKNGDRPTRYQSRIRGLSSSLSRADLIAATEGFEYRVTGCCVYNMINVIRGSFVSFENPKGARSWDILAGINLALEQGLQVMVEGQLYRGEYLSSHRRYRFKVEQKHEK
jgi:myo-inositol-1(or 4)-monophosphatase